MMRNEAGGRILPLQIPQKKSNIWLFPPKTSKFGSIHVKFTHLFKQPLIPRSPRVLHQKARNFLLTAHVSVVSTAPVVATYALYWGLDPTPTLNVLPKYTCMVVAPHMGACA